MFKQLAIGLYEPDPLFKELPIFRDLSSEGGDLPQFTEIALELNALTQKFSDEKFFQEIIIDYTRLFLAPGAPGKIYLSCWKDILGEDIVERYLKFIFDKGYEVERDVKDLPEHLSIVLEIYDDLEGNDKEVFAQEFLEPFFEEWCKIIENNSKTGFYKKLSKLLFIAWTKEKNGRRTENT